MKPRRIPSWALSILGLVAIVTLQVASDTPTKQLRQREKVVAAALSEPLVPSTSVLKALSLGNQPLAADLLWLDTVQYFGSTNPYGTYASLPKMLDTITQLDPQFECPYEFSLIVLPFMNEAETAVKLGLRAQEALPNRGLLTYYLATVYHLNLKDYKQAAFYYQKAINEPGAPGAAQSLAGTSLAKITESSNDRLVAMNFWKTVYENAKNEDERERAKNWYQHMEIVYTLERLVQEYKNQYGEHPVSLQTLVERRIIREVPKSPIGRQFSLDRETGIISFDTLAPSEE